MSCSSVIQLPLTGLRVLDLADETASFCGRLLADVGAEVVKIEPPGGDPARNKGLFINKQQGRGSSLSYLYFNSGKKSITLDMSSDGDRARFLDLAAGCDIIIETFMQGYLTKLGLGYQALTARNPGLIMASVTGFGQSGPRSGYKSCDLIASAAGGQMHICGRVDRPPLKPYGEQPYYLASMCAATGILLALRWRRHTGKGQHIDISLQEATASALDHVLVRYFSEGIIAQRRGSLHWNGSSDLFPCRDGHALISFNREWETLLELLESEGLGADFRHPAWSDEAFRHAHLDDIDEAISLWTSLKSRDEVFKLGQSMRLPWAALYRVDEVLNNEHLLQRSFFVEAGHPGSQKSFSAPRPVICFGQDEYEWKHLPAAGENNDLRWDRRRHMLPPAEVNKKLPLEGVRVLDFTWMLAGPYATRILADFGAEVIKVQSKRTATGAEDNSTAYFAAWNRGKLGITLDLSRPEASDIILALVKRCDVVMENFTPRVMRNWGLAYERLQQEKSDLIMVSLSGFGQTGPWRDFAALGPTVQALSGMTKLTSYDNGVPYGIGFALADHVSGLYAALAVLAALERRDSTGSGAYIDISEYEATCSLLGPALLDCAVNSNIAQPAGNRTEYREAAPHGCYKCKGDDRWLVMAVYTDAEWHSLCDLMGSPELAANEKFSTPAARVQNEDEIDELIGIWTAKYTRERLTEMLHKKGIAASPVYDARDLAGDAHLKERGFLTYLTHPVLGEMCTDATPIRLGASPAVIKKAAPLLGEDNHRILLDLLGMEEKDFNELVARGVIG